MAYLNHCCLKDDKSPERAEKQGKQRRVRKVMQKGQGEVCANEVIFHEKVQILKRYVGTYHYSFVKHVPIDNK